MKHTRYDLVSRHTLHIHLLMPVRIKIYSWFVTILMLFSAIAPLFAENGPTPNPIPTASLFPYFNESKLVTAEISSI